MSWNYRIVKHRSRGQVLFSIREMYYDKDGTTIGTTSATVDNWETLQDLQGTLAKMLEAFNYPVVEE